MKQVGYWQPLIDLMGLFQRLLFGHDERTVTLQDFLMAP